jgi:hypothetical protein
VRLEAETDFDSAATEITTEVSAECIVASFEEVVRSKVQTQGEPGCGYRSAVVKPLLDFSVISTITNAGVWVNHLAVFVEQISAKLEAASVILVRGMLVRKTRRIRVESDLQVPPIRIQHRVSSKGDVRVSLVRFEKLPRI